MTKVLIIILLLLIASCTYKIDNNTSGDNTKYEKTYSIKLKNKVIGYCGKLKNDYLCKIFLKNGNKKFNYKISMTKDKNLIKYNSPSVKFTKKIKPNYLIYPFLFENIDKNTKVYYPETGSYIEAKYLSIKKIKNGYIATPFKYIKTNTIPKKIEYLDILEFREVKSQKINKEYPTKYKISFESENIPPSDLRQKCTRIKNSLTINCTLSNQKEITKIPRNYNITDIKSKKIENFIKKYKLSSFQKEDLIPRLINALHKEINYKDISKKMTTDEILDLKQGDCTEFSQVAVDVLRKLNISSKRIYGLIYRAKKGKWLYHSWVEYDINKITYAFDPVNKVAFLDLNYLKLGEENKYGIIIIPLDIENLKFIEIN